MKTCLLFLALFNSYLLNAQSAWKPLGSGGLVSNPASKRSVGSVIATDSAGTPYVAYTDVSDSLRLIIKKFDGTNWVDVGNLGYHLRGNNPSIYISKKDSIYVGYYNYNDSMKPTAIKFDGTNWVQIGSSITQVKGSYNDLSLVVDDNDKIYLGYGAALGPGSGSGHTATAKANIFTYDGTDWVIVGNTDFLQYSSKARLCIGLNNELYVGYNADLYYYYTNEGRVQKWNGTQWDTVGQGLVNIGNIIIAPDGTTYCNHFGKTTSGYPVEKLVNNVWTQLVPADVYDYPWQIQVDKNNTLYFLFSEAGSSSSLSGLSLKKFTGTFWNLIGTPMFFIAKEMRPKIAFGKNNVPYIVASVDASVQGGPLLQKIYAWYYDSVATSVPIINRAKKINIYPNPLSNNSALSVELPLGLPNGLYSIGIYNLLGQPVYETNYTFKGNTAILQLQPDQQLSKGLYYLRLYNGLLQHTAFFTVQ